MWKEIASVGIIAVGAPIIWMSWTSETVNPPKREMSPEETMVSEARTVCKNLISDRLHDPGSAEWGTLNDNFYGAWPAATEGNEVTVAPKFRATNSFGTTILSQWKCVLAKDEDEWRLVTLDEF